MDMDSYEIEVILVGPGAVHDEAFGEVMLEAFLEVAPEADPVVEQNVSTGRIMANLTLSAESFDAAMGTVLDMTKAALARLSPSLRLTGVHLDAVTEVEPDSSAALAPC